MISSRALQNFNLALLDLYAPGLDLDNYAERGFRFLTRLVSVELSVHGMRDVNRKDAQIIIQFDRTLPNVESAIEPFGQLAPKYPWFCGDPTVNGGKPYYRTDFYSDRQYRSLDIHSEVFQRWGHENFMTMYIHSAPHRVYFFGFSRDRKDFSGKERKLLEWAQPHLMSARQLAVALSAVKPWTLSPEMFSGGGFTPREGEVLYWLTEGKSNIEIATILRISLPTIKGYLTSIFNKTGTGNRLAAMLHALDLARKFREEKEDRPSGSNFFTARFGPPLPK